MTVTATQPEMNPIQKHFSAMRSLLVGLLAGTDTSSDLISVLRLEQLHELSNLVDAMGDELGDLAMKSKIQFMAMAEIERMMNSALGLDQVLEGVMDTAIKLMEAERGFLMLKNADEKLAVQLARGLDRSDLAGKAFDFSNSIVQQVATSGEPVLSVNAQEDPRFWEKQSVIANNLRSILCVPLRLKGAIIGVIFVDNRVQVNLFDENDQELLSAFADQAAIAIENARLFADLQQANQNLGLAYVELQTAYDATLKGWVRALDLRDRETSGHTQRVTAMARILARAMGMSAADLITLTRGAWLHDIGKMAIPDAILHKPGGLNQEEFTLMKNHTVLAYEMLSPIQFLNPALDIPYCHHEWWDGSGYPRGLSGEGIPLQARIFAIVDVWDAVTSDRVYHKAMDADSAREFIRGQSGTHFDARIVETFLGLDDLSLRVEREISLLLG